MGKLTFNMENYLEAVYELSSDNRGVRVTDIADRMGVSKASTNNAMSVLSENGLITNEKYQEVYLTAEGLEFAKSISSKHRIIQRFLTDVLKVDIAIADTDACAIEHVISSDSVFAMLNFLKSSENFNRVEQTASDAAK